MSLNNGSRRDLKSYPVVGPDGRPIYSYIDVGTKEKPDLKRVQHIFDGRFFVGKVVEAKDERFVPDQLQTQQNKEATQTHRARMAAMVDQA